MKPRHAAALALVGCLIAVPSFAAPQPNARNPSSNLETRKERFRKCSRHQVEVYYRGVPKQDRGTEEAGEALAVDKCAKYITKEEQDCADHAKYGYQIGNPFRCEDHPALVPDSPAN
jgi:hypothetical protein